MAGPLETACVVYQAVRDAVDSSFGCGKYTNEDSYSAAERIAHELSIQGLQGAGELIKLLVTKGIRTQAKGRDPKDVTFGLELYEEDVPVITFKTHQPFELVNDETIALFSTSRVHVKTS